MRRFIRSPLTWLVAAELVVVGAMVAVTWALLAPSLRPAAGSPVQAAPAVAGTDEPPLPDVPGLSGNGARGPLPGLNLSPAFWRARLIEINREQTLVAKLEWRLVHAAMTAAESYVKEVVLPAIRHAERAVV